MARSARGCLELAPPLHGAARSGATIEGRNAMTSNPLEPVLFEVKRTIVGQDVLLERILNDPEKEQEFDQWVEEYHRQVKDLDFG